MIFGRDDVSSKRKLLWRVALVGEAAGNLETGGGNESPVHLGHSTNRTWRCRSTVEFHCSSGCRRPELCSPHKLKAQHERRGDYDAVPSMGVEGVCCTPFSTLLYLYPRIKSNQNFSQ